MSASEPATLARQAGAHPLHDEEVGAAFWLARVAREPLLHFVLLGLLLWWGVQHGSGDTQRYTIRIGPTQRRLLAENYARQFGQAPSSQQLRELIDRYIHDEIFVREGMALGLAQDDEIVRRRIVQKYEFLQTDLETAAQPQPQELQRWFEQNSARYQVPPRVTFSQIYFSPDIGGDARARERAVQTLETLRRSRAVRAPSSGDPFPGPSDPGALGEAELVRLFGESELATRLPSLPVEQWSGPLRSGYGWHLVYVTAHLPAQLPPLRDVYDRVLADYQQARRESLAQQSFAKLRSRYTISEDAREP